MKKSTSILHAALMALTGLVMSSCMLMDEAMPAKPGPTAMGYARLDVELAQTTDALRKAASADTIFSLDSLIVVLSATGAPTQVHRFPISGRSDLGNVNVGAMDFELAALRTWKAKFISIDTTVSPTRRDTVHLDSVSFNVQPGQTTFASRLVSPVYSILRVRFISSSTDSIATPVQFVRLRVNGVMRDSTQLGGSNASLNWLQAMSGSTIHAVGDSGRILRSTNDGSTWTETQVTTAPLVGGHFQSASVGLVVSKVGTMYHTEDGGGAWQTRATLPLNGGIRDTVTAFYFPSSSYGFVTGQNGAIHKTENGWQSWKLVSNTLFHLNGIHFPTATTGYVVGENETILKTVNADAPGGTAPQDGGIVWAPVAGGWFNQTSNSTNKITSLQFSSTTQGWALGHNYAFKTTDGGATWLDRTSGIGGASVNAISMQSFTAGFAAGQNGTILKMAGNEWSWQPMSNSANTINNRNLNDIRMVTGDSGYAVGASGAIVRTVNGSAAPNVIIWASQLGWYPLSGLQTWRDFYSVRFGTTALGKDTGWTTGTNGAIFKTTNRGGNWVEQTSNTSNTLFDLHVHTGTIAVAVGASGTVRRTVNGGATWSTITSGVSDNLNATAFVSRQVGWYVGAGNRIRSTNDSGKTWTSRDQTGTHYGISVGTNRIWVVGATGKVLRSSNRNHNTTFATVGNTGLTSFQLNAVEFISNDVGWVVGSSGKIFKTTNGNTTTASNVTWTSQTSGTTQNLTHVHFIDANTGYVSGANGIVLKTTNGGTNWVTQTTGTTNSINDIHLVDANTLYAAGHSGTSLKTTDGGNGDTTTFTAVEPVTSMLVYVSGSGGKILKTTNAGELWTAQSSGTTSDLKSIAFRTSTEGFAVGKSGTILKTTNGGTNWVAKSSGTSEELTSVRFVTPDTGYVTGKNGLVIKTGDGGESWYSQETPTGAHLNRVHAFNQDLVFSVGDSGRILKAVNEGDNWTGGGIKRSLKGVHFPSETVGYIVGADGTILKTSNGGAFWTKQTSGTSVTLYGVFFTDVNTGWVSGANGTVLRTTNGGANWVPQTSGQPAATLRWTHFRNSSRGFMIGGSQTLVSTTNGGANWTGSFVGVPGLRTFDETLSYKYLKPNQSHTILFQAIDQVSPLRGYQGSRTVIVGAGQDSTIVSPLTRCGYGGLNPACTP